jgi:hypothetical protein
MQTYLGSVYLPIIIDNNIDIKHNSNVVLKLKNISGSNCFIVQMIIMEHQ